MENNFGTLIKKSIEHYDNQNQEYSNQIKEILNFDRKIFDSTGENKNRLIIKNKFEYEYELLGIFNIETKTFVWSWCFIDLPKYLATQSKFLLKYGLEIGISNHDDILTEDSFYLKILLCNSRFSINDEFQLNIILAICSYVLSNRIDFIIKRPLVNMPNIIEFYIVKQIFLN